MSSGLARSIFTFFFCFSQLEEMGNPKTGTSFSELLAPVSDLFNVFVVVTLLYYVDDKNRREKTKKAVTIVHGELMHHITSFNMQ